MNKKTISKKICSKISEWHSSIKDEGVRKLAIRDTIVTGGSICSMLLNEEPKDYDIYFKTKEAASKVAQYYIDEYGQTDIKLIDASLVESMTEKEKMEIPFYISGDRLAILIPSDGVSGNLSSEEPTDDIYNNIKEDKDADKYKPIFFSPNAITLSDKIQIVIRFFGEVEEIHSTYDFVHTTNSWESNNGSHKLTLRQEALESILARELFYQGSKYPVCSIIRTRKFLKRGWNINAGQYLKMIMQCNELDLYDVNILHDQLVGVDSAFFSMLTKSLHDVDAEKLNSSYIATVIDRIFS